MSFVKSIATRSYRFAAMGAVIAGATAVSGSAHALPTVENYADFVEIRDGRKATDTSDVLMFADNENPNAFYVPYDQIELVKIPGSDKPAFSFVFNEDGGIVTFTVRASHSAARKATIREMITQGKQVKPLAPIGGGWMLGVVGKSVSFTVNGQPLNIQTVLPDVPVSLQLKLDKTEVGLLVQAFKTGANVSVNYVYQFRGATTPFWVHASVNWFSFRNFLQTQTLIATQHCEQSQNEGGFLFWTSSANAKACGNSFSNVRDIVRTAIQNQTVRIVSLQSGTDTEERTIDELTKMIISKQFKPMDLAWEAITPTPPTTSCEVGGSGSFSASCYAEANSFVWNNTTAIENISEDYYIQSQGVMTLPAAVGGSLNAFCGTNPDLFVHSRTGKTGCPTTWDDSGIKQQGNGGPVAPNPAAVLPADRTTPPAIPMF